MSRDHKTRNSMVNIDAKTSKLHVKTVRSSVEISMFFFRRRMRSFVFSYFQNCLILANEEQKL